MDRKTDIQPDKNAEIVLQSLKEEQTDEQTDRQTDRLLDRNN